MALTASLARCLIATSVIVLAACAAPAPQRPEPFTTIPTGSASPTVSASDVVEDLDARQSATVTAAQGAEFVHTVGGVTLGVVVPKGAFPKGTTLTFTPLAEDGTGVLAAGFRIRADGDRQPRMPVAVVFRVPGDLGDRARLVAYADDGGTPGLVRTQASVDDGTTTVTGIVRHFTIFRIRDDDLADLVPPWDEETGFKGWSIKAVDTQKIPGGEPWDASWKLSMTAHSTSGTLNGPYRGTATLTFTGKLAMPPVTGTAGGSWKGPITFERLKVYFRKDRPASRKGEPYPALNVSMVGDGSFTAKTAKRWKVKVSGPTAWGGWQAPISDGDVPVSLGIAASGAHVFFGDVAFDAVPVGVLE